MDYTQATLWAATGSTIMLPNFIGYFKWDYSRNTMIFENGDYRCDADKLDILNRTDFYRII